MNSEKSSSRIIALDLLRGYFLFVIIINHLHRVPGFYELFTGQDMLWASAAEGFILISGLMIGLVRGRQALQKDLKIISVKLFKRSGLLYMLAILFTFLSTLWAIPVTNERIPVEVTWVDLGSLKFYLNLFTFQYVYGLTDYLRFYALFLFFSPVALWLLIKRKWYVLLGISFLVWYLLRLQSPFFAWQILFFVGTIAGFYLHSIESWLTEFKYRGLLVLYIVCTTIFTFAASVLYEDNTFRYNFFEFFHGLFNTVFNLPDYASLMASINTFRDSFIPTVLFQFHKIDQGPGRVLVSLLWFIALYMFFRKFEEKIMEYFGKFLIVLSQNSLFVYCLHAFLILLIDTIFLRKDDVLKISVLFENFLINSFVLFVLWKIADLYSRRKLKVKNH